jgi:ADP-ribose pyrophosphatase
MKFFALLEILCSVFLFECGNAQVPLPPAKAAYFDYWKQYPDTLGPNGDYSLGEIEIIFDRQQIAEIEKTTQRQVGVMAEDKYWLWLNDAVRFPNGKMGVYGRILWRQSLQGIAGIAVMPVLPNGKICLNRNYRHATRSWEYELPRGCVNPSETVEEAAFRETREETGMVLGELVLLGKTNTDSGITNTVSPVFLAKVIHQDHAQPEDSEAIAGIEAFSIEEIKRGLVDGYLSKEIDGKISRINLRDPFLAFAVLLCDLKNDWK